MNLPFNTTTDGFTFTGTSTQGSVTNSSGTLKVVLKSPSDPDFPIAAQKNLTLGLTNGDKIRVKATVTNKTGTSGVIVQAIMLETDPSDPYNYVENVIGNIENGAFDANYTVSDFVANPILKLRFIVSGDSPETSNGGGTVAPSSIFYIDNLKIDKIPFFNQEYDNKGRITQNKFGDYKYEISGKPYQNSKVRLSTEGQNYYTTNASNDLDIKYNMFSSPYKITHATKDIIDLSYNIMEQRSIMYWGNTNTDKNLKPFRRYYSADGSIEVTAKFTNNNYTTPSSVEIITFVDGTAYNAEVVLKNTYVGSATTATGGLFYLHRDYQGSIVAITNSVGAIIEKRQYDPWGLLTKIQDGSGNNLTKLTFFDRGYTGHEHLETVGLINMNGRVYDPILHRFLQPDSQVQEPHNTQNYNRYGYCLNNPLKYTDISGESYGVTLAITVAVALVLYLGDAMINDKPITFDGIARTVVISAVSAAISYGIGTAAAGVANFYTRATVQALAHGLTQGGMTALSGGKFWSGFAAGCISSIMSSAWQGGEHIKDNGNQTMSRTNINGIGGVDANNTIGTMFFGTISGGAGSALTGGNFWRGAVTGLIVSGFNHAMHGGFAKNDSEFIYLHDDEGASGLGHSGGLAGNDDKGYIYASKDGRAYSNSEKNQDGTILGGGKSTYTYKYYASKELALQDLSRYESSLTFKTTYRKAMNAINIVFKESKSNYHILFSNCGHAVSAGLRSLDLYGGGSYLPDDRFRQVKSYYNNNFPFNLR